MRTVELKVSQRQLEMLYIALGSSDLSWEDDDEVIQPSIFSEEEQEELLDLLEELI